MIHMLAFGGAVMLYAMAVMGYFIVNLFIGLPEWVGMAVIVLVAIRVIYLGWVMEARVMREDDERE